MAGSLPRSGSALSLTRKLEPVCSRRPCPGLGSPQTTEQAGRSSPRVGRAAPHPRPRGEQCRECSCGLGSASSGDGRVTGRCQRGPRGV